MNYSFTLPAGEYFIGDPCYIIRDWDKAIEVSNCFDKEGLHNIDSKIFCGIGTEYGDGTYLDNHGHEYSVDSGLIGATSIKFLEDDRKELSKQGFFREFNVDVECGYADGVIFFGGVMIDTSHPHNEDVFNDSEFWHDDDTDD